MSFECSCSIENMCLIDAFEILFERGGPECIRMRARKMFRARGKPKIPIRERALGQVGCAPSW